MRSALTICFAVSLFATAARADPPATAPSAKSPVPDAAALRDAGKVVDDVYKQEIAAVRTGDDRKALAVKLLQAGIATRDDLAGRYTLLSRARDMAADLGDYQPALVALYELGQTFALDEPAAVLDVCTRLARSLRGAPEHKVIASYLLQAVNEALAADQYDGARKLADLAVAFAARTQDAEFSRAVATRARELREAEPTWTHAKPFLATLAQNPADAQAAFVIGRLRCLIWGQWDRGLPLLAAGSDAAWAGFAKRDLAGADTPEAKVAIGDGWWATAEKAQGVAKTNLMMRARTWYAQAGELSGLTQAKVQQRMKESEPLLAVIDPQTPPAEPLTSATASADPGTPNVSTPSTDPPVTPTPPKPAVVPVQLPQGQFVREWREPAGWAGKPEQVQVRGDRISITNNNGANTVCKNAQIVRGDDGSIAFAWNDGPGKEGFEVWSAGGEGGKEITIRRWDNKGEKESGREPRRVGFVKQ